MTTKAKGIMEAENRAIETTTDELLSYYSQREIIEWWITPIIGNQNPLALSKEGRARFLVPFVRSMVAARKNG